MSKLIFAIVLGVAMTATASAHIWSRSASPDGPRSALRLSPCPISYAFERGFCVRVPVAKKSWFKQAIDDIL